MSLYIMSSSTFGDKVKIGITFDPCNRVRNMQTSNPEPVRYVCMYSLTYSNNISLKELEKHIHTIFSDQRYFSNNFEYGESRPTEFFLSSVIVKLDQYMDELRRAGQLNYCKFSNLNEYSTIMGNFYNENLYEILKGTKDMDYGTDDDYNDDSDGDPENEC